MSARPLAGHADGHADSPAPKIQKSPAGRDACRAFSVDRAGVSVCDLPLPLCPERTAEKERSPHDHAPFPRIADGIRRVLPSSVSGARGGEVSLRSSRPREKPVSGAGRGAETRDGCTVIATFPTHGKGQAAAVHGSVKNLCPARGRGAAKRLRMADPIAA